MYIIHLKQNWKSLLMIVVQQLMMKSVLGIALSAITHTCECILDISSACCNKLGNIILSAGLFEQTIVQCCELTGVFGTAAFRPFASPPALAIVPGNNCKFDDDIECNDWCRSDDEIKPGGVGSTFSAISMARCKCAFLSQSSIEYSSDANLIHRIERHKMNEWTIKRTNKCRNKNRKNVFVLLIRFDFRLKFDWIVRW